MRIARFFFIIVFLCSSLLSYGMNSYTFVQNIDSDHVSMNHTKYASPTLCDDTHPKNDYSEDCAISCFFSSSSLVNTDPHNVIIPLMTNQHIIAYAKHYFTFHIFDIFRPPTFYPYFLT